MAIRTIGITELQPARRQWAQNAVIGLDGSGRLALMPAKEPLPPDIPEGWGEYVGTCAPGTYQMDVYQRRAVMKTAGKTLEAESARFAGPPAAFFFRQALYEKTLQGNVFIVLRENSQISVINGKGEETLMAFTGMGEKILGIAYAFNRLVITTESRVCWSAAGLPAGTEEKTELNFKQSDSITQAYLGCWSDSKCLYLYTAGGYEVWKPTTDEDSPFIYSTAEQGSIAAFDGQWCLMETDWHGLGIFSVLEEKFLTGEEWAVRREDVQGMQQFRLPQTGNKALAVREGGRMWLLDIKHRLATKFETPFLPCQEPGEQSMDMQIKLLLEKGVYGSLLIQTGQLPEEAQLFMDNFCMRRAPLPALARDGVIKTASIGKLTADTEIEINFKGCASIYSLGLEQPAGG